MDQDTDYWESATDSNLCATSLSTLSKSLPARTAMSRTLALYLRWLEIHRCSESKSTQHWVNTIMHWTQALRARGFTEEEINKGVKRWKESKEYRVGEGRDLPSWEDVETVFLKKGLTSKESGGEGRRAMEKADEREERRERRPKDMTAEDEKESLRGRAERKRPLEFRKKEKYWPDPEEKYAGVPYKGYICKRCGDSGHHLQACPTNLDPSWDEPPEKDYECTICGITGHHYKSLCPRNCDPMCLNQKRKRAGIMATPEKKSKNMLADWERDISHRSRERLDGTSHREGGHKREYSRSSNLSRENDTPTSNKRQELFATDEKRRGLLAEDQADFIRKGNSKSESTSTSKYESTSSPHHRKRAREYPENESNFGRLSLGTDHDSSSPEEGRKRVRFAEPTSPPKRSSHREMGMGFAARAKKEEGTFTSNFNPPFNSEGEMELDNDLSDDGHRPLPSSTLPTTSFPLVSEFKSSGRDIDVNMADYPDSSSSEEEGKIPMRLGVPVIEKKYNAFVMALMKRHPEMSVVVNVRRCGRAMDLWNSHSSRRVETYVETIPDKQASSSPMEHPHSDFSPPLKSEHDGTGEREEDEFMGSDGTGDDLSPYHRFHLHHRTQKRTRLSHDDRENGHDGVAETMGLEGEQRFSSPPPKKRIFDLPRTFSNEEEEVDVVYPRGILKFGGESFGERESGMRVEILIEGELRIECDGDEHLAKDMPMDEIESGGGGEKRKGMGMGVEVEAMELSD